MLSRLVIWVHQNYLKGLFYKVKKELKITCKRLIPKIKLLNLLLELISYLQWQKSRYKNGYHYHKYGGGGLCIHYRPCPAQKR